MKTTLPGFTESIGTKTLVSGCTITAAAPAETDGSDDFADTVRVFSIFDAFNWFNDGLTTGAAGVLKYERKWNENIRLHMERHWESEMMSASLRWADVAIKRWEQSNSSLTDTDMGTGDLSCHWKQVTIHCSVDISSSNNLTTLYKTGMLIPIVLTNIECEGKDVNISVVIYQTCWS